MSSQISSQKNEFPNNTVDIVECETHVFNSDMTSHIMTYTPHVYNKTLP